MAPPLDPGRAGLRCPRCGYDLRGLVGAWKEACPLHGRCGECGLDFAWRDLFSESAYTPRWCIEFAPSWLVLPAAVCTAAMAVVPWRFWKAMRMTFALRGRRLAIYVLLLAAGCYACFAIGHAVIVDQEWQVYRGAGTLQSSRGRMALHAALMPFSSQPMALVRTPGSRHWLSPRGLLHIWQPAVSSLLMGTVIALACPLVLAALVATRRQAGIRGAHIVRIAACSAAWLAAIWLGVTIDAIAYTLGMQAPINVVDWVLLAGSPVWLPLWWHAALHHYLHLTHAWATAIAITMIGVLIGILAVFVIDGDLADYILWRFGLYPL